MPLRSRLRLLARLTLAWFVLALGVAVAAPLLHPPNLQRVCSVDGSVRWVAGQDTDARTTQAAHVLDCVLCLPGGGMPASTSALPAAQGEHEPGQEWAQRDALLRRAAGASLPARGPPHST